MNRRPLSFSIPALILSAVLLECSFAEDVVLKDGNVVRGVGLRREGAFIFGKPSSGSEALIPVNTIARIAFPESSGLRDAREKFFAGDSRAVLDNTASEMTYHKLFMDIPGSLWTTIMRLRIPALVAGARASEIDEFLRDWTPSGDAELDAAVGLLKLKKSNSSAEDQSKAWKTATEGNPSNLSAAISWLELGNAALEAKDWTTAIRYFVSVQVFSPNYRPLHPAALLGAVKACLGNEQPDQATPFAEDLKKDYPRASQTKALEKLLKPEKQP